jgi:hypothetical protein
MKLLLIIVLTVILTTIIIFLPEAIEATLTVLGI